MSSSALSFLTNGQTNAPVTLGSTSSVSGPQWMQDYTEGLLNNASSQAYSPFTPQQVQSFNEVQGLQGAWQPFLTAASSQALSASNPSALSSAMGYLPQSSALTYGALNGTSGLSAASPYLNEETALNNPGTTQAYLNPYINDVVNASENLSNTNFTNNVLPAINDEFISNGQYGSAANQRQAQLAGNQLLEQEQLNAGSILGQGYGTAQTGAQTATQLAGGEAGTAGSLGSALQQAGLTGASQLGSLGQISGGLGYEQGVLGLQGASELGSLGSENLGLGLQGATALNTVGNQIQQYPEAQTSWLAGLESGLANPYTTGVSTTGTSQQIPGLNQMSPSPLSSALGAYNSLSGLASAFGYGSNPYPDTSSAVNSNFNNIANSAPQVGYDLSGDAIDPSQIDLSSSTPTFSARGGPIRLKAAGGEAAKFAAGGSVPSFGATLGAANSGVGLYNDLSNPSNPYSDLNAVTNGVNLTNYGLSAAGEASPALETAGTALGGVGAGLGLYSALQDPSNPENDLAGALDAYKLYNTGSSLLGGAGAAAGAAAGVAPITSGAIAGDVAAGAAGIPDVTTGAALGSGAMGGGAGALGTVGSIALPVGLLAAFGIGLASDMDPSSHDQIVATNPYQTVGKTAGGNSELEQGSLGYGVGGDQSKGSGLFYQIGENGQQTPLTPTQSADLFGVGQSLDATGDNGADWADIYNYAHSNNVPDSAYGNDSIGNAMTMYDQGGGQQGWGEDFQTWLNNAAEVAGGVTGNYNIPEYLGPSAYGDPGVQAADASRAAALPSWDQPSALSPFASGYQNFLSSLQSQGLSI